MSSILGQIETEHPELFALEFVKIAESDFVYALSSTNIDQSYQTWSNVCDHKILDEFDYNLIRPELSELLSLNSKICHI